MAKFVLQFGEGDQTKVYFHRTTWQGDTCFTKDRASAYVFRTEAMALRGLHSIRLSVDSAVGGLPVKLPRHRKP